MKLTKNWRTLWRTFSAQALASCAAFQAMLAAFPASMLDTRMPLVPFTLGQALVAATVTAAVIGFIGRHVDQGIATAEAP